MDDHEPSVCGDDSVVTVSSENSIKMICSLNRYTANQGFILQCAYRNKGRWVSTTGMCNVGGFSGRGLHRSLGKLADDGWIEVRERSPCSGVGNSHRHSFTASVELIRHVEA